MKCNAADNAMANKKVLCDYQQNQLSNFSKVCLRAIVHYFCNSNALPSDFIPILSILCIVFACNLSEYSWNNHTLPDFANKNVGGVAQFNDTKCS